MRMMGFSAGAIERWTQKALAKIKPAEAVFDVHPDNVFAVRLILAMQTQWNSLAASTWSSAIAVATGLKYEVLETTARLSGLGEISPDDFLRVRILEAEILSTWAEARR